MINSFKRFENVNDFLNIEFVYLKKNICLFF